MNTTIIPAICTPLDQEESLHRSGLEAHLEEQWAVGIPGVLVGGSMGCMQLLRDDTYFDLVRHSVDISRGRGEILVGVGDASFERTRARIQNVDQMDIDGVVVLDPYLFKYSQTELLDYHRTLADISRKPVYIYHLPVRTGAELTFDTVVSLSKHPNIQGIKCTRDEGEWARQIIPLVDDSFRVMAGHGALVDMLIRAGVREHVDGVHSLFPQWTLGIAEAADQGDWDLAAKRQEVLSEFIHSVLSRYPVWPSCTAILNARGIPGNVAPRPMCPLDQQTSEQLLAEPTVMRLQNGDSALPAKNGHGLKPHIGRHNGRRNAETVRQPRAPDQ